jgi:hypothetical protein
VLRPTEKQTPPKTERILKRSRAEVLAKWGPLLEQVEWLGRYDEHIPDFYTIELKKVFEFLLRAEPEDVERAELWPLSLTILSDRLKLRKTNMRERLLTLEDLRLIRAHAGRPDNPKTGEKGRPFQFTIIVEPGMVLKSSLAVNPNSEVWKVLHPTDKPGRSTTTSLFVIPSLVTRIVRLLRDKQARNEEKALPFRQVARLLGVSVKQIGDALSSSEDWKGLGLVFAGLGSGRRDRRGGPRKYVLWLERPK